MNILYIVYAGKMLTMHTKKRSDWTKVTYWYNPALYVKMQSWPQHYNIASKLASRFLDYGTSNLCNGKVSFP